MNELIKELAEQARAWVDDSNNVHPEWEYAEYRNAYDKKFAELIIKECADEANQWHHERALFGLDVFGKHLKRMFGVEE